MAPKIPPGGFSGQPIKDLQQAALNEKLLWYTKYQATWRYSPEVLKAVGITRSDAYAVQRRAQGASPIPPPAKVWNPQVVDAAEKSLADLGPLAFVLRDSAKTVGELRLGIPWQSGGEYSSVQREEELTFGTFESKLLGTKDTRETFMVSYPGGWPTESDESFGLAAAAGGAFSAIWAAEKVMQDTLSSSIKVINSGLWDGKVKDLQTRLEAILAPVANGGDSSDLREVAEAVRLERKSAETVLGDAFNAVSRAVDAAVQATTKMRGIIPAQIALCAGWSYEAKAAAINVLQGLSQAYAAPIIAALQSFLGGCASLRDRILSYYKSLSALLDRQSAKLQPRELAEWRNDYHNDVKAHAAIGTVGDVYGEIDGFVRSSIFEPRTASNYPEDYPPPPSTTKPPPKKQ